ncbi:hypothetical protein BC832DRAFT_536991 [Gaertneriomyces semiglobifer]|nr:hypothetical protein BC832DRAFT_536991 [Gaertneriomyces semiglobifer]
MSVQSTPPIIPTSSSSVVSPEEAPSREELLARLAELERERREILEERVQRAKERADRAKEQADRAKERADRAKEQADRAKERADRAKERAYREAELARMWRKVNAVPEWILLGFLDGNRAPPFPWMSIFKKQKSD